jgi:hypothetical protein
LASQCVDDYRKLNGPKSPFYLVLVSGFKNKPTETAVLPYNNPSEASRAGRAVAREFKKQSTSKDDFFSFFVAKNLRASALEAA